MNKTAPTSRLKNERAAAIERKSQKNDKYNAALKGELALLKTIKKGEVVKRIAVI